MMSTKVTWSQSQERFQASAGCSGNCTPTSARHRSKAEPESQEVEMLDASAITDTFLTGRKVKKSTKRKRSNSRDRSLLYYFADEGSVETTRASRVDSGGLKVKENQSSPGSGSSAPRLYPLWKQAAQASGSGMCPRSDMQSNRKALQYDGQNTGQLFPNISTTDSDHQVRYSNVAQRPPVRSRFGLDERISDAAFDEMMRKNPPGLPVPANLNNDHRVVAGGVTGKDVIRNYSQSLVMSQSSDSPRLLKRQKALTPKPQAYVGKSNISNLRPGLTVELKDGTFVHIKSVKMFFLQLGGIIGHKLVRDEDNKYRAKLPDRRLNELVWVNEIDEASHQKAKDSFEYEFPAAAVKQIRAITFTNSPSLDISYQGELVHTGLNVDTVNQAEVRETGNLYCRWKSIEVTSKYKTDAVGCLRLLTEEEATGFGRFEPSGIRKEHRGDKHVMPGGSSTKQVFDLETQQMTCGRQQYTLGDCFCGAGGVSRGAVQAGVALKFAFDHAESAVKAHKENFSKHGTRTLALSDTEMLSIVKDKPEDYSVDIVHYSPPCQAFSKANHNQNKERDFENQKPIFSLPDLTTKLKPRIATIEETTGLLTHHPEWFNKLVNLFTSVGYSLRWKIVRCHEYGVPQIRERLLLIAAAPGETLPNIPGPTHGDEESGLKRYVTINDAIRNIPPTATLQNMMSQSRNPESLPPFSGDTFARCITTTGGQFNYNPDGWRKYNLREMACLQGFPTDHAFSATGIVDATTQIGNAVPPPLAKTLFEEIIRSLKETDRIEMGYARNRQG